MKSKGDFVMYLIVMLLPALIGFILKYDYFTIYSVSIFMAFNYLILDNVVKIRKLLEKNTKGGYT